MRAEKLSALTPKASDWISVAPPRSTGQLSHLYLSLHLGSDSAVETVESSDRRHAMAYADGVRIITPSITAWPPTMRSRSRANIVWMSLSFRAVDLFFITLV